jgi:hypothetical protein
LLYCSDSVRARTRNSGMAAHRGRAVEMSDPPAEDVRQCRVRTSSWSPRQGSSTSKSATLARRSRSGESRSKLTGLPGTRPLVWLSPPGPALGLRVFVAEHHSRSSVRVPRAPDAPSWYPSRRSRRIELVLEPAVVRVVVDATWLRRYRHRPPTEAVT